MIASADRRLLRYSLRGLFVLTTFCAVAAWIYREFCVPPLSQIAGLSVETASDKGAEVLFDERATRQTVEHLLGNLKDGSTFWCFLVYVDRHHGALVTSAIPKEIAGSR